MYSNLILEKLKEKIEEMESQGLTDTPEYEEITKDYHSLAMDFLEIYNEHNYND